MDSRKTAGKSRGAHPRARVSCDRGHKKHACTRAHAESFKADLEDVYKRGYRPITIAQILDKDFSDVPAGMSPVVFVFDDASPSQFRYVQGADGKLTIDPTSGVGIWLDFAKTPSRLEEPRDVLHAERRVGRPQLLRRQSEVRRAEEGVALSESEMARRQRVRAVRPHASGTLGSTSSPTRSCSSRSAPTRWRSTRRRPATRCARWRCRTGSGRRIASSRGKARGPIPRRNRRTTTSSRRCSRSRAVRRKSPYDPAFNPHSITRVQAVGNDIHKMLDQLDASKSRFVK